MNRPFRSLLAVTLLLFMASAPSLTHASAIHCNAVGPARVTHQFPQGNASAKVISFGVKGGSLRPWSVVLTLDGSVTASGVDATTHTLTTPQDTLKGLLTLAEAEGFFSMNKQIGCPGSGAAGPDSSARTIAITTSTGTKRVSVFGSCKASFNQLYAVLQQIAGTNR